MNHSPEQLEFLNPFAEGGPEVFDAQASFEVIAERYLKDEVKHSYTADQFVKDTEALMLDATFLDRLEEANAIAGQMHIMCQHDHNLMNSVSESSLLGQHAGDAEPPGALAHGHEDDEYEVDSKTGKLRRKRRH